MLDWRIFAIAALAARDAYVADRHPVLRVLLEGEPFEGAEEHSVQMECSHCSTRWVDEE